MASPCGSGGWRRRRDRNTAEGKRRPRRRGRRGEDRTTAGWGLKRASRGRTASTVVSRAGLPAVSAGRAQLETEAARSILGAVAQRKRSTLLEARGRVTREGGAKAASHSRSANSFGGLCHLTERDLQREMRASREIARTGSEDTLKRRRAAASAALRSRARRARGTRRRRDRAREIQRPEQAEQRRD